MEVILLFLTFRKDFDKRNDNDRRFNQVKRDWTQQNQGREFPPYEENNGSPKRRKSYEQQPESPNSFDRQRIYPESRFSREGNQGYFPQNDIVSTEESSFNRNQDYQRQDQQFNRRGQNYPYYNNRGNRGRGNFQNNRGNFQNVRGGGMNNRGNYIPRGNFRGNNYQNRGMRGNYRGRGMNERFRGQERDDYDRRETFDKREEEPKDEDQESPLRKEEKEFYLLDEEKKETFTELNENPIEIKDDDDEQDIKRRRFEEEEYQEEVKKVQKLQTKEDLLSEIDKIELEITKYETRIEDLEKERQNHFLEEQRKRDETIIKKKPFQHPFYLENQERSRQSEKEFENLLYKDQSVIIGKCVEPSTLDLYQRNEERHKKMMDEIEKEIETLLTEEEERIKPISEKYKNLKQEWKRQCTNDLSFQSGGTSTTAYIKSLAIVPPLLKYPEREFIFESKNSQIEDPVKENKEVIMVEQSWTIEDKKIFMKKFSQYPKDYRKIQQYLPNKTMGDLINFYYNNKNKNKDLMEIIKSLKNSKKYTKKVIDEGPTARNTLNSSELTARELRSLGVTPLQAKEMGYLRSRGSNDFIVENDKPKKDDERLRWTEHEKSHYLELFAIHGRNFAEIAKNIKVKNEAQCKNFYNNYKKRLNLDNLLTPEQKNANQKKKPGKKPQLPIPFPTNQVLPSEEDHEVNDPSYQTTEKGKKKRQISYWSQDEKDRFMQLYNDHGRDWKKIAELIPTKTQSQVKNFFQNYKVKLGLAPQPEPRNKKKSEDKEDDEVDLSAPPITPETLEPKKIVENILSNPMEEKKKIPMGMINENKITPNSSPNPMNQMLISPSFLMINPNKKPNTQTKHARIAPNIPNQIGEEKKSGITSLLNQKEPVEQNPEFQNIFNLIQIGQSPLLTPQNFVQMGLIQPKKGSPITEKKDEMKIDPIKQFLEKKEEKKMEEKIIEDIEQENIEKNETLQDEIKIDLQIKESINEDEKKEDIMEKVQLNEKHQELITNEQTQNVTPVEIKNNNQTNDQPNIEEMQVLESGEIENKI